MRKPLRELKERLRRRALIPDAAGARAAGLVHFMVFDHAILRVAWTNLDEIAPGVFRSNQPGPARIARHKRQGLRTIINLRGTTDAPHYTWERAASDSDGITQIDIESLAASSAPPRAALQSLIAAMRQAEKPMLMHCKSGADRSSLAAAIYLMVFEGATPAQARRQFSMRYIHFKWTKKGVLDHILDAYEAAWAQTEIRFEDWLANSYDADALQRDFDARRG